MTAADLFLLRPSLERVMLPVENEIETPDLVIKHAFFLEEGLACVVAKMKTGRDIQIGMIGYEGMTGSAIVLNDTQNPHQTFMQIAGSGLRISSSDLMAAMENSLTLRIHLTHFTRAFYIQVSSTAWANGATSILERLARCLLMVNDRVEGEKIMLTHHNLSKMLGVQRTGLTVAIHLLEGKGLIESFRSEIRIQDLAGLRDASNGGYGKAEADYARLLSWSPVTHFSSESLREAPRRF